MTETTRSLRVVKANWNVSETSAVASADGSAPWSGWDDQNHLSNPDGTRLGGPDPATGAVDSGRDLDGDRFQTRVPTYCADGA